MIDITERIAINEDEIEEIFIRRWPGRAKHQ
jgi:hypothetical protein